MTDIQSSKLRKHFLDAIRIAAWFVAGIALLMSEIFVFGNWANTLSVQILGAVICIGAIILLGISLYRWWNTIKKRSHRENPVWTGSRELFLAWLLLIGLCLGLWIHGALPVYSALHAPMGGTF